MINLISPLRLISIVAMGYAAAVILMIAALSFFDPTNGLMEKLRVVTVGGIVLDVLLLLAVHVWWRKIWSRFPFLSTFLFPDLNGSWHMTIHWNGTDAEGKAIGGVVNAIAKIKQSFLHMSMEVESEDSDSETLIAKPRKDPESGRPLLYYVYRVVPRKTCGGESGSYEGAAILRFDTTPMDRLAGNYFTSRMRQGYFSLKRE